MKQKIVVENNMDFNIRDEDEKYEKKPVKTYRKERKMIYYRS